MNDLHIEDEVIEIDLESIYKLHSANSHLAALTAIFEAGVQYARETHSEELQERHDELLRKHEALKKKVGAVSDTMTEGGQQEKIRDQAMGMGLVFKT